MSPRGRFFVARLDNDTQPEDEWAALVLAALEGPGELETLLADGNGATQNAATQREGQEVPGEIRDNSRRPLAGVPPTMEASISGQQDAPREGMHSTCCG